MDILEKIQEDFNDFMKQAKEKIDHFVDVNKMVWWKPKKDDEYYYVDTFDGSIDIDIWIDSCTDNNRYSMGYVFKTKKEALKELERRWAEVELLNLCDWEGGVFYSINYYESDNSFDWLVGNGSIFSPYRFKSVESVKKAIETIGTDKLKLVFRIED